MKPKKNNLQRILVIKEGAKYNPVFTYSEKMLEAVIKDFFDGIEFVQTVSSDGETLKLIQKK